MRLSYINQKEGEVRFYAACHFNHCHPYRDGNRRIPLTSLGRFGYAGHCLSDLFIPVFQGGGNSAPSRTESRNTYKIAMS